MRRVILLLGAASLLLTIMIPALAGAAPKVTICHVPPGNPANAHTISVDDSAVPAHLAHGDYLGACKKPDDDNKKIVYYKKENKKTPDPHDYTCEKAPSKFDVPKDSLDKKFYSDAPDAKKGKNGCEVEKKVYVKIKKDKNKKRYDCVSKNKAWAVLYDKDMYKDDKCKVLFKKSHA